MKKPKTSLAFSGSNQNNSRGSRKIEYVYTPVVQPIQPPKKQEKKPIASFEDCI
jgi:hypothetical protein